MAAAMPGPRKSVSIYDYPEHLNPFREGDNHNKIRFWTLGRKINRSNSINFSGIKTDLKKSWAFRSFMKKGKKAPTSSQDKTPSPVNGDSSPVVFRRALQYSTGSTAGSRTTIGSPERPDRYVYGGSMTPLPRSRFQERLRSPSQHEVNSLRGVSMTPRLARSDVTGSQLSVESTNPFDEDPLLPPVKAVRRKKKRAAPLPPGAGDISVTSVESETQSTLDTSNEAHKDLDATLDIEDSTLNIELKIVEDVEERTQISAVSEDPVQKEEKVTKLENKEDVVPIDDVEMRLKTSENMNGNAEPEIKEEASDETIKKSDSEDDILNKVSFPKINITKYRRNSSINEDDIRLRRGNLEDFTSATNKRSKSLNNNLNTNFVTFDMTLNDDIDDNGNEQPQKVVCKLYDDLSRKRSIDTISSCEREFIEIDKATREFQREISELTSALIKDDTHVGDRLSVSDIRKKFDNNNSSPNPIPKPRRSHYGSSSPVNGI